MGHCQSPSRILQLEQGCAGMVSSVGKIAGKRMQGTPQWAVHSTMAGSFSALEMQTAFCSEEEGQHCVKYMLQ